LGKSGQQGQARLELKDVQIVVPKDGVLPREPIQEQCQVKTQLAAMASLQLSPQGVLKHLVPKPTL
jgi:hypothetical protein